jgi:tetratricopeptide (TPR) repeat protein
LVTEREAVTKWLVAANHQPVHSYRPDSETVRESCLNDIDGCDLYVLILGHRYGFQPDEGNPEKLSITHLEFRRAEQSGIPRIALLRTSVPDVSLSDLLNPERAALINAFIEEVRGKVRPAEFRDPQGLIQALSTGVQGELEKLVARPVVAPNDPRVLQIVATLTDELDRKNRLLDERAAESVALQGRVRELEGQLQAAIARTLTAAAQADAGEAAIAAADALESGDTRPAEALLSSQEQEEAAQIGIPGMDDARQRREAAALAREQGALALGHNIRAALESFQRAVEYEPDHIWTQFYIGDLHVLVGDLGAAMRSFRKGAASAESCLRENPDDSVAQRNLSVSQYKIGDVLVAQGDGPAGLAAYRTGLAITEALAGRVPANTLLQRDLSVSHEKIGDVLEAQGDGPGALAAYRTAMVIRESLAVLDPANTLWQRDLSVIQNKIGDVLVAQGDELGALASYRRALAIREALTLRDPANTEWQRDLSVSHERIGNLLVAQGDGQGALAAYRTDLAITEALALRDPANTLWQRDLSVSQNNIGDVLVAQRDEPGALAAYRRALAIIEGLALRDPANTLWQRDVAFSCAKLGTLMHGQDEDTRRNYLLRGREIIARLKREDRLAPSEDWIAWFDARLAELPPVA